MGEVVLTLGVALKWAGYALTPLFALPLLCFLPGHIFVSSSKAISRWIDSATSITLGFALGASILIVVAQMCVVILRYVFGLSFSWLSETVLYSFATIFLLASASALRDDDHVRVDILRGQFSANGRAWVDLIGIYIFLLPICALVIWSSISPSFVRSWMTLEASRESDGLPLLFLFRTLIPVFAVLLAAQGLSQALKAVQVLTTPKSDDADRVISQP